MSKARTYFAGIALTALAVGSALALGGQGAGATGATGSWSLDAPCTTTHVITPTGSSVSTSHAYHGSVQQPINADGSSNWQAKRGVIPVKFKVMDTPITTTTPTSDDAATTTCAFRSITADLPDHPYAA